MLRAVGRRRGRGRTTKESGTRKRVLFLCPKVDITQLFFRGRIEHGKNEELWLLMAKEEIFKIKDSSVRQKASIPILQATRTNR